MREGRDHQLALARCARLISFGLIWLTTILSATRLQASPCPDYLSSACLDSIRTHINHFEYNKARNGAEDQCYSTPKGQDGLPTAAIVSTASGCYYLALLERFLGNGMRAIEAREKSHGIATWGCEHGITELCEVLIDMTEQSFRDLLSDIKKDLSRALKANDHGPTQGIALGEVKAGRILPKQFSQQAEQDLNSLLQNITKVTRPPCPDCLSLAPDGKTFDHKTEISQVLTARIDLEGPILAVELRLHDSHTRIVTWKKTYTSSDLLMRRKLFGLGADIPEGPLKNRTFDPYEPTYKYMAGLGASHIKNGNGIGADHDQVNIQIRSAEIFGGRRHEFGMLASFFVTRRIFEKKLRPAAQTTPFAETTSASPVDENTGSEKRRQVPPFATAFAFYGVYNHLFFGERESFDSPRPALNIGLGGFLSSQTIALSARVGFDLFIGQHYVISAGAVGIGASSTLVGDETVKIKPVVGSDFILSFNF